jgi:hypothetical protein
MPGGEGLAHIHKFFLDMEIYIMLVAHIVPGYFAAHLSKPYLDPSWNRWQHYGLWVVAIGSTVAPDTDVIYNIAWRGFTNHSTLWTHSLFPYLILVLILYGLHWTGRWFYLQSLIGLAIVGGLSHLVLDVIAHSTPLLYPINLTMFGIPPQRVVDGGFWAYLTDPIFLIEPILIGIMVAHWILQHSPTRYIRIVTLSILLIGLEVIVTSFLYFLPLLQMTVTTFTQ